MEQKFVTLLGITKIYRFLIISIFNEQHEYLDLKSYVQLYLTKPNDYF